MDLADHSLIQLDIWPGGELIDEFERRPRTQDFERVFAWQGLDADTIEQTVDLEIGECVALDPR